MSEFKKCPICHDDVRKLRRICKNSCVGMVCSRCMFKLRKCPFCNGKVFRERCRECDFFSNGDSKFCSWCEKGMINIDVKKSEILTEIDNFKKMGIISGFEKTKKHYYKKYVEMNEHSDKEDNYNVKTRKFLQEEKVILTLSEILELRETFLLNQIEIKKLYDRCIDLFNIPDEICWGPFSCYNDLSLPIKSFIYNRKKNKNSIQKEKQIKIQEPLLERVKKIIKGEVNIGLTPAYYTKELNTYLFGERIALFYEKFKN